MGMESWEFFDYMLNNIQVVGTPGAGFGDNGKYFFRLTAFGTKEIPLKLWNASTKCFRNNRLLIP